MQKAEGSAHTSWKRKNISVGLKKESFNYINDNFTAVFDGASGKRLSYSSCWKKFQKQLVHK